MGIEPYPGYRPDLTNFDFENSPLLKSKSDLSGLVAFQLTRDEVIRRPWGVQDMYAGDWVVLKPAPGGGFKKSGVRKEAFDLTYVELDDGRYRKESYIRAEKINYDFQFVGVDSEDPQLAPSGSHLVLNLDKNQNPIFINGKRDIYFYSEEDLVNGYDIVQTTDTPR